MATMEEMAQRLDVLEGESQVRKLQYAYGYYLDKCLYNQVVDLYTEDGECKFMGGTYRGRASLKRLYLDRFGQGFTGGSNRNVHGFLLDHSMMQFIIDVSPDGKIAKLRGRTMMQSGSHESIANKAGTRTMPAWWEGGLYENSYRKENGVWKIWKLHYYPIFHGTFDEGWARTPPDFIPRYQDKDLFPGNPGGPDEIDKEFRIWPHTDIVPFHYDNPVTGEKWVQPPRLP